MAMGMMGQGYGLYGYGWIFNVLILIVLLLVIWWVLRQGKMGSAKTPKKTESPGEILKRRLAEGEITVKEYKELKKEVSK